ncbi:EamA family transporter, partial [Candidatus Gottesmanbacteria bacterium]|nr:EamA family transporter [Candidatus Gottesmanbacteria bacterium]
MSWFVLILLSANLFSLASLIDKFLTGKFKSSFAYGLAVNILLAVPILLLSPFVNFSLKIGWPLFFAVISGRLYFLMWVLFWLSLKKGEVSRSAAIFNTALVFNAFLAVVFLGETLSPFKWLAILFIVSGAMFCSWENESGGKFNFNYLLVVLATIIGAIANIISKIALREIEPLALYAISYYGAVPFFFFLASKKEFSEEVKENFKKRQTFLALSLRVMFSFIAVCFFYLALSSGPVSLVVA